MTHNSSAIHEFKETSKCNCIFGEVVVFKEEESNENRNDSYIKCDTVGRIKLAKFGRDFCTLSHP